MRSVQYDNEIDLQYQDKILSLVTVTVFIEFNSLKICR